MWKMCHISLHCLMCTFYSSALLCSLCFMCSQYFITIIGIIEMSDEAVDEAIRVCDSNIRLRYVRSKNVHTHNTVC